MANYILASRGKRRVGKLWAHRFVKRTLELKTRFPRSYDFQRAVCEDPKLIEDWFRLVANIRHLPGRLLRMPTRGSPRRRTTRHRRFPRLTL